MDPFFSSVHSWHLRSIDFCLRPFAEQIIVISIWFGGIRSPSLAFLLLHLHRNCVWWLALFLFGGVTSKTWHWLPELAERVEWGRMSKESIVNRRCFSGRLLGGVDWSSTGREEAHRFLLSSFAVTGGVHGKQLFYNLVGDRLRPQCVCPSVRL